MLSWIFGFGVVGLEREPGMERLNCDGGDLAGGALGSIGGESDFWDFLIIRGDVSGRLTGGAGDDARSLRGPRGLCMTVADCYPGDEPVVKGTCYDRRSASGVAQMGLQSLLQL